MVRIEIGAVVCTGESRKGSNFVTKIQTFLRERISPEARDQHQKLCLIQHLMRYTVLMQWLTSIPMPLQESLRLTDLQFASLSLVWTCGGAVVHRHAIRWW